MVKAETRRDLRLKERERERIFYLGRAHGYQFNVDA